MCQEWKIWILDQPQAWGPWGKAKLRCMHYNIPQGEADLRLSKLTSVSNHLPSVGPKQLCALSHQGGSREAGTS